MNELVDALIVAPILAAMILGALPTPTIKTTPTHLRRQPIIGKEAKLIHALLKGRK